MKDLNNYVNEKLHLNTNIDKYNIKASEKKQIQNAIYKQLRKTGTTGRLYHDEAWEGVRLVKKDIEDAFYNIKNPNHEYEVSIAPDNGGYRKSKDGLSQWKQYKIEIYVKGNEEPFMTGTLNCHAAGSVEDPFDAYDMSCTI